MTDTITLPRSVVEQALEAMESGVTGTDYDRKAKALRAALEQPQVEQEPVAEVTVSHVLPDLEGRCTAEIASRERLPVGAELFIHPQNLRCKSNQARLATLWGYVKPQPRREPLTDKVRSLIGSMVSELRAHRYCGDCYPENGWPEVNSVLAEYASFKRAHGIGGEA